VVVERGGERDRGVARRERQEPAAAQPREAQLHVRHEQPTPRLERPRGRGVEEAGAQDREGETARAQPLLRLALRARPRVRRADVGAARREEDEALDLRAARRREQRVDRRHLVVGASRLHSGRDAREVDDRGRAGERAPGRRAVGHVADHAFGGASERGRLAMEQLAPGSPPLREDVAQRAADHPVRAGDDDQEVGTLAWTGWAGMPRARRWSRKSSNPCIV
jgi:hypothetical protein